MRSLLLLLLCAPAAWGVSLRHRRGNGVTIKATAEHSDVEDQSPEIAANDPRDDTFTGDTVVPSKAEAKEEAAAEAEAEASGGDPGFTTVAQQEGDVIRVARVAQDEPEAVAAAAAAKAEASFELPLGAAGGGVTKGFCKQMMTKIGKKEAPYFLEDKYTGENRDELLSQCNVQICGFALAYKKKVDTCEQCPKDCSDPLAYAKSLIASDGWEKMFASSAAPEPAQPAAKAPEEPAAGATGASGPGNGSNDPRDPDYDGNMLVPPCESEEAAADPAADCNQTPAGPTGLEFDANAPAVFAERKQIKGGVTKGFCTGMLKSIEAKKAPYFLEGEFTGETRDDLVEQCAVQVCDWAVSFGKLTSDCAVCPDNCAKPMSKDDMKAFVADVLGRLQSQQAEAPQDATEPEGPTGGADDVHDVQKGNDTLHEPDTSTGGSGPAAHVDVQDANDVHHEPEIVQHKEEETQGPTGAAGEEDAER